MHPTSAMLRRHILLITGLALMLCCCSKTNESPRSLLQIKVSPTYPNPNTWAFITDSRGEIVVSQPLTFGALNELMGSKPDTINLTLLTYQEAGQGRQAIFDFDTYPNVPANSIISLVQSTRDFYNVPTVAGTASVTVTGYSSPGFLIPNITVANGFGYFLFVNQPAAVSTTNIQLNSNPADLLLSSYTQDYSHPVYAWVNNVTNGNQDTVGFSSFQPFPKTVSMPYSSGSLNATLSGYRSSAAGEQLYLISDLYTNQASGTTAQLGWLDGFDSYEIQVTAIEGVGFGLTKVTSYYNSGATNAAVALPDFNMTILNAGISDFQFFYSAQSQFQVHTFGYSPDSNTFINWNIYSNYSRIVKVRQFPADILSKFPVLDFSKLKFSSSTFYHFANGYSYPSYFLDLQLGNYPLNNPEYFQIQIQQN